MKSSVFLFARSSSTVSYSIFSMTYFFIFAIIFQCIFFWLVVWSILIFLISPNMTSLHLFNVLYNNLSNPKDSKYVPLTNFFSFRRDTITSPWYLLSKYDLIWLIRSMPTHFVRTIITRIWLIFLYYIYNIPFLKVPSNYHKYI